eukprot:TRINITY_DN2460_c0_g1_i4.p2 TRINITY_DN2460_c0_g1~~TRINITY_DN2460_c0_g1_i4.p2  ORF type:complete len:105 (-),score=8.34 TRINITY_DN2460_c0_g1_i4:169-483(-)
MRAAHGDAGKAHNHTAQIEGGKLGGKLGGHQASKADKQQAGKIGGHKALGVEVYRGIDNLNETEVLNSIGKTSNHVPHSHSKLRSVFGSVEFGNRQKGTRPNSE